MSPGVKLAAAAVLVAAAIGYLALLGAAASWQYYLSVDEAVADAVHLEGHRLRVSGRVTPGSLSIGEDRRQAAFDLAGERHTLHVTCRCLMPDNLAEDIEVVVEGVFEAGAIHGDKVITRCASKYEPADTTRSAGTRHEPNDPGAGSRGNWPVPRARRDEAPAAPAT